MSQIKRLQDYALAGLVESFAGSLVVRGTNVPPTDALTNLAQLAYKRGAADARHQREGIQRDVRERADSYLHSFTDTATATSSDLDGVSKSAWAFLRELFVNALLEARETTHVVDWSNPDQVELYTIAVEAESKRYEEINERIAAAEKAERCPVNAARAFAEVRQLLDSDTVHAALHEWCDQMIAYARTRKLRALSLVARDAEEALRVELSEPGERNPFADTALAAIPNWFDEMRPLPSDQMSAATGDPLFTAALNRAFAIGVLSATQEHPEPTE